MTLKISHVARQGAYIFKQCQKILFEIKDKSAANILPRTETVTAVVNIAGNEKKRWKPGADVVVILQYHQPTILILGFCFRACFSKAPRTFRDRKHSCQTSICLFWTADLLKYFINARKTKRIAKVNGVEPRCSEDIKGIAASEIDPKGLGNFERQAPGSKVMMLGYQAFYCKWEKPRLINQWKDFIQYSQRHCLSWSGVTNCGFRKNWYAVKTNGFSFVGWNLKVTQ